ncbi:hypothetical protein Aperf_G00000065414 [Anoplocephala perfoliata]
MAFQYSSNETVLATEATEFFSQSQFGSCFSHMKKLYSTKSTDPKVIANKALAEFIHQNNLTHSDEYLERLRRAASLAGSPISLMKSNDQVPSLIASPTLDPSIFSIHYNYALVLFHQRRFSLSEHLLANLLGISELDAPPTSLQFPIKAGSLISQRCLLLWLDVCFSLYRYQRVFEFASFCLQQIDDEDGNLLESDILEMLKEIDRPLRVYRLRACLHTGRLKAAEDEMGILSRSQDSLEEGKKWDISKSLEFARAQLSYLQRDQTSAVKQLTTLLPSADTWDSPLVLNNLALTYFYSGHLGLGMLQARAALRCTERLSVEICASSSTDAEDFLHHIPLNNLNASRHIELLYNAGLGMLMQKKSPKVAFEALLSVVKIFPRNPRLWLRLAECCILLHRPNNLVEWSSKSRSSCLQRTLGGGLARKLVIGPAVSPAEPTPLQVEPASPNDAIPSMEFAAQCVRNAALLLPRPPIESNVYSSTDQDALMRNRSALLKWANEQSCPAYPSSQVLSGQALLQVISAVLLTGAYVSLCLDDPLEAIHYAEQLLSDGSQRLNCPEGSFAQIGLIAPPAYRYLAKMYLAEARIAMDELPEASESLFLKDRIISPPQYSSSPLLATRHSFDNLQNECTCLSMSNLLPQTHPLCGISSEISIPGDRQSVVQQSLPYLPKIVDFPFTVTQAIGVLFHNMAVCLLMREEQSESRYLLERASTALLVNIHKPDLRSDIREGSEENKFILYPPADMMGTVAKLLATHQFPKQFLRTWVYLESRQGRSNFAAQFLRAHIGNEAYGNPIADAFIPGRKSTRGRTSPLVFEIEGGILDDLERRQLTRHLSMNQLNGVMKTRPTPLQIHDPPQAMQNESTGPKWTDADWPPL